MKLSDRVAGIDLGTTNSCIAVVKDNQIQIVEDGQSHTFPSYVSFTNRGRVYGMNAKK